MTVGLGAPALPLLGEPRSFGAPWSPRVPAQRAEGVLGRKPMRGPQECGAQAQGRREYWPIRHPVPERSQRCFLSREPWGPGSGGAPPGHRPLTDGRAALGPDLGWSCHSGEVTGGRRSRDRSCRRPRLAGAAPGKGLCVLGRVATGLSAPMSSPVGLVPCPRDKAVTSVRTPSVLQGSPGGRSPGG